MPGISALLRGTKRSDRQSRWAMIVKELDRLGWTIDDKEIAIAHRTLPLSTSWQLLRPILARELKKASWQILAERRPRPFGELKHIDVASRSKLLKQPPPYSATILLRVWCGCTVTRAHRSSVNKSVDPTCDCSHP